MKTSIFICFLIISTGIHAKTIQIGIGGGSTIVTGNSFYKNDLQGTIFQDDIFTPYENYYLKGLDFNFEYNLNIKTVLSFKDIPINLYSEVDYNKLIGKGTIDLSPSPISSYLPPPQKSESRFNLTNVIIGIEYELLRKNIIPFLSTGIIISRLGDIEIEGKDNYVYKSKIMNGGIRYGVDFGVGLYYRFYKNILLGVSLKYTMNNLIGGKETEKKISTIKNNFNIYYQL